MALTDTFVKKAKYSGKTAGDKHTDGADMYLLVKSGGRYWRMDYRFAEKRKTLAYWGVYPAVSLAKARQRREAARELLAAGFIPAQQYARTGGPQSKPLPIASRQWRVSSSQ